MTISLKPSLSSFIMTYDECDDDDDDYNYNKRCSK